MGERRKGAIRKDRPWVDEIEVRSSEELVFRGQDEGPAARVTHARVPIATRTRVGVVVGGERRVGGEEVLDARDEGQGLYQARVAGRQGIERVGRGLWGRSEEHKTELQSPHHLLYRL